MLERECMMFKTLSFTLLMKKHTDFRIIVTCV